MNSEQGIANVDLGRLERKAFDMHSNLKSWNEGELGFRMNWIPAFAGMTKRAGMTVMLGLTRQGLCRAREVNPCYDSTTNVTKRI